MINDTLLKLEDALVIVRRLDIADVIKRAYYNNGVIYLDLSCGALLETVTATALKLYCMPNPLDHALNPSGDDEPESAKCTEIDENQAPEDEGLEESCYERQEESGYYQILGEALSNEEEVRADWENRIKEFYFVHTFIRR